MDQYKLQTKYKLGGMSTREFIKISKYRKILLEVELKTPTGTKYYKLVQGTLFKEKPEVKWNSRYSGKIVMRKTVISNSYFMLWGNEDNIDTMGISPLTESGSRKSQSAVTKIFMKAIEDTKNMTFKRK